MVGAPQMLAEYMSTITNGMTHPWCFVLFSIFIKFLLANAPLCGACEILSCQLALPGAFLTRDPHERLIVPSQLHDGGACQ